MDDFLYDLPHRLLERGTVNIPLRPEPKLASYKEDFAKAVEASATHKTFKLTGYTEYRDKVYPIFEEQS